MNINLNILLNIRLNILANMKVNILLNMGLNILLNIILPNMRLKSCQIPCLIWLHIIYAGQESHTFCGINKKGTQSAKSHYFLSCNKTFYISLNRRLNRRLNVRLN